MLQVNFLGTLGADAEKKTAQGRKFTTFRAAHNERWTDTDGNEQTMTTWVDFIMNDHPKVADYLRSGTQVYVTGSPSLRVYSSPKDRCMKAGMTIHVQRIELVGGKVDAVPRQLIDSNGVLHNVQKFFHTEVAPDMDHVMTDKNGNRFAIDDNGWVVPVSQEQLDELTKLSNASTKENG